MLDVAVKMDMNLCRCCFSSFDFGAASEENASCVVNHDVLAKVNVNIRTTSTYERWGVRWGIRGGIETRPIIALDVAFCAFEFGAANDKNAACSEY